MNKLKYIRYSRKSSESKEKQVVSIQDQNSECDKYSQEMGLRITYKLEEAKSAFKPNNRPEFDRMITLLESKQADAIITWKPDRLCRNPQEGGILLQLLQDGTVKEIRTPNGELYTQDSDHLILQLHFGMANQYSRNLSQNVKRGLDYKCERGEYPRPAIVGYKTKGDRGRKNLVPHQFEGPIIKELFKLASDGRYSISMLIERSWKRGLKTKSGKKLSRSHIHKILTTPTYYGYFTHNGEMFKGNYEALVSKRLFDKVQEVLSNRSKPQKNSWKSKWNGIMFCASCGCAVTTSIKRNTINRLIALLSTNTTVVLVKKVNALNLLLTPKNSKKNCLSGLRELNWMKKPGL